MNVREILKDWLVEHKYDGLVHCDTECGCGLDDFIPCDGPCDECEPAYKNYCNDCPEYEECEHRPDNDMGPEGHCYSIVKKYGNPVLRYALQPNGSVEPVRSDEAQGQAVVTEQTLGTE